MGLTVSKLAQRTGVSPHTVRYYDRIGLLRAARRSDNGYRLFDDEAEVRLGFIQRAQRFGLRLDAIAELLDIRERGLCPCGHTRQLVQERLVEIERERRALDELHRELESYLRDTELRPPEDGCVLERWSSREGAIDERRHRLQLWLRRRDVGDQRR